MESHTPAAPRTDHTTATATTVTMPNAIESRNAVFMIDHGSTCTSRSRARRVPRGRGAAEPERLADDVRVEPPGTGLVERVEVPRSAVPDWRAPDDEPDPRGDEGVAACWIALPV